MFALCPSKYSFARAWPLHSTMLLCDHGCMHFLGMGYVLAEWHASMP